MSPGSRGRKDQSASVTPTASHQGLRSSPASPTEAELRTLGWVDASAQTDVLVCRLSDVLGEELPDPGVQVVETLTASWEAAYQRSRPRRRGPRGSSE